MVDNNYKYYFDCIKLYASNAIIERYVPWSRIGKKAKWKVHKYDSLKELLADLELRGAILRHKKKEWNHFQH